MFNNGEIIIRLYRNSIQPISLADLKEESFMKYEWRYNSLVLNDGEKHLTYILNFDRCEKINNYIEAELYECENQFGTFYVIVDIIYSIVAESLKVLNELSKLIFNVEIISKIDS